jgi:hypothetical protein
MAVFVFGFVVGFLWADHKVLSHLRDGEDVTAANLAFMVVAGVVAGLLLYVYS